LEAFKREDPPTQPQLAVPVAVPNWIFLSSRKSIRQHIRAVGELCLIAFYFLLRVGKYTQTQATHRTRTQQFRLRDICFFFNQRPVPLQRLIQYPEQVDLVRLQIDNQKNGRRGQIIAHHAIDNECCPVKACVARVRTLLQQNASPDTLLCAYRKTRNAPFTHVTNSDIVKAVRTALNPTGAHERGYEPNLVGSHSLRSGGTMALFNQGVAATTIMKIGRWTSTTFMTYIHEQVDTVSKGAAEKMSIDTPFVNLAVSATQE